MRLGETGIQYQKIKFGQLAGQITADREAKLKPLDYLPRGGAAQAAKVRVHIECIDSLAQAFVGAYIEAYQKAGVDIDSEDVEAIIGELRCHVKSWFQSLQARAGIGQFIATQTTDANSVVARARQTISLNVHERKLAQDRIAMDILEQMILEKLSQADVTFTIAQFKASLPGCSSVTDEQWFAALEELRRRGFVSSPTPAGPFVITAQGKNHLLILQRSAGQPQQTGMGDKREIHGQVGGAIGATARGSDLWRSIQGEFRALVQEEQSHSPNNADDSWLIASVSYRDPSTPYGDWTVYRGISEDFKARFEALATRAGKMLEPTAPCKPLHVWLHRLFLNLLEYKSEFLFAAEEGVGGIIKTVSTASVAYSARLEMSALEQEDDSDVENDDRRFAQMATEEALKSAPEDERPHPKVGAVVVKDRQVLAVAHRGEFLGSHAEYIALEKKLADSAVAGATVYTTLEPCTLRDDPKIACAFRLAERKVARVVIGMIDPNPDVSGKGCQILRDAAIQIQFFPPDLMSQVEELNREFIRDQKAKGKSMVSTSHAVKPVPLYRAYHPQADAHFYTTDLAERDNATNNLGYKAEQIACLIFPSNHPGTVPLYRAFLRATKDHFYTIDGAELDDAIQDKGYVKEPVAGYVYRSAVKDTVPLYRLFRNTHFYTADPTERDSAVDALKYQIEKIACYVFPPFGPDFKG